MTHVGQPETFKKKDVSKLHPNFSPCLNLHIAGRNDSGPGWQFEKFFELRPPQLVVGEIAICTEFDGSPGVRASEIEHGIDSLFFELVPGLLEVGGLVLGVFGYRRVGTGRRAIPYLEKRFDE